MSSFFAFLRYLLHRIFAPGRHLRHTYRAFRKVLEQDRHSHERLAALERLYHEGYRVDFHAVCRAYEALSEAVLGMIRQIDVMIPRSYTTLFSVFQGIDLAIRNTALRFEVPEESIPLALPLDRLPPGSSSVAGGKASNLSEIARLHPTPDVPKGFVITVRSFYDFCRANRIQSVIENALADVDIEVSSSLEAASDQIRSAIRSATLAPELEKAIHEAWVLTFGPTAAAGELRCAVRSSAVGEDAAYSFAGQYRSVLHIDLSHAGEAYKQIVASKYSPNALLYRIRNGFLDQETPMAVLVLEMVDAVASGVVYSRNPVDPGSPNVTIYSVWGLGEPLVGGSTLPDVIEVSRDDLGAVCGATRGARESKTVPAHQVGLQTVSLDPSEKERLSLDESTARQLASLALRLEEYFGCPQDTEWCLDRRGRLLILQSRPLRIESPGRDSCRIDVSRIPNPVLFSGGEKAAPGWGSGTVALAHNLADLTQVPHGSVLVGHSASPSWARVMPHLSAVVTDLGSVAGHFASVAREWNVPTLVGTGAATRILKAGELVTVDADRGRIYAGIPEGMSPSSCESKGLPSGSPFMKRFRLLLDLCSPLHLLNPQDPDFTPAGCKSLHDLVRYTHEMAVREMFSLGGKGRGRIREARKLISEIPVALYVLDLADGTRSSPPGRPEIRLEEVDNPGLRALWKGLGHPEMIWSPDVLHFDWQEFDRLSAGIISLDSQTLASFAVVSRDYLNIHIRFGYHFVVIDALFGAHSDLNYISMRFKGGGAVPERRLLRIRFLDRVMRMHGLHTLLEGDGIDVNQRGGSLPEIEKKLEMLGFLLGFTRLLDQKLENTGQVDSAAEEFLKKYPPG